MIIDQHFGVEGRYKLMLSRGDADGNPVPGTGRVVGEFPNLITNNGMDALSGALWFNVVRLGTGNTTPAVGDTALANQIAASGTNLSLATGGAADGSWSSLTATWVFAQGAVVGNVSEIGTSSGATGNLFSRALIVDGSGAPTTISVTAMDILTVVYEFRVYYDLTDKVTTVNVLGVDYTLTTRACQLGARRANSWYSYGHTGDNNSTTQPLFVFGSTGTGTLALGPVTGDILRTGTTSQSRSAYPAAMGAYTAGSFTRTQTFTFNVDNGNVAGGIKAVSMWEGNERRSIPCQTLVSPPIPKDATKTMTWTVRFTWSRYTP